MPTMQQMEREGFSLLTRVWLPLYLQSAVKHVALSRKNRDRGSCCQTQGMSYLMTGPQKCEPPHPSPGDTHSSHAHNKHHLLSQPPYYFKSVLESEQAGIGHALSDRASWLFLHHNI